MKQFILVLGIAFSVQVFSQETCDIQRYYGDFIKITKKNNGKKDYLYREFVKVDSQYCFADYVNNNLLYVDFFTSFCSNCRKDDLLIHIDDSIELQSAFIAMLQEDSLFNAVMQELTAKVINKTVSKDTITMDALLNIAVKYFYVQKITEEGYYAGKVCWGINGILETEQERKPFIEAFAGVSIVTRYYDKTYNMQNELVNTIKELYNVNLGVDKEERLLRARGAVFMQMFYNQKLRDMLLYEYEHKKDYLPFVLRDVEKK